MWVRLLVFAALGFLVAYAIRDFLRANPQLFKKPSRRGHLRPVPSNDEQSGAKVLSFRRQPHEVLGIEPDAPIEEAEKAWEHLRAANDPGKLEEMSEDLQTLAAVRCQELDDALEAFRDTKQ